MALAADDDLKRQGVAVYGVAQKDSAENIRRFLGALGDPYAKVGLDADGRAGIDWGVYGVPETFVVSGDGTIAFKFVGPMTAQLACRRPQAADPQGDGAAAATVVAAPAPPSEAEPARNDAHSRFQGLRRQNVQHSQLPSRPLHPSS